MARFHVYIHSYIFDIIIDKDMIMEIVRQTTAQNCSTAVDGLDQFADIQMSSLNVIFPSNSCCISVMFEMYETIIKKSV